MIFLSLYPLSSEFIEKISVEPKRLDNFISLSNIGSSSYKELIFSLLSLKPQKLFLCLENKTMVTAQNFLLVVGFLTRAKEIFFHYGDGSIESVSRTRIFFNLITLARSSLVGLWSVFFCTIQSFFMLRSAPKKVTSTSTKKILYLKTNSWLGVQAGGSVGHISGVVNALIHRNSNIFYASFDSPAMLHQDVNIINVDLKHGFGIPYEANVYTLNKAFYKKLSQNDRFYNLIYQRLSLGNYTGVLLSRLFNIPLILEYNGSEFWVSKNWGKQLRFKKLAERAELICLKHAHLIVVVSDVLKQELLERGVKENKIVSYPNCVDPNIFNPKGFKEDDKKQLRQKLGLNPHDRVATFIGTFGKWHGIEILARAIRELYENHLDWMKVNSLRFLLIGDGICMEGLKEILKDPLKEGFVILTGLIAQDKAPLYLSISDIFLSPHCLNPDGSRFFGSPTKLFEYMSMEKPILASDLEQIGDVLAPSISVDSLTTATVIKDEMAILCQPNSEKDIIIGLTWLVDHYEEAKKMGMNARQKAVRLYTWEKHVDVIMKALQNVKT